MPAAMPAESPDFGATTAGGRPARYTAVGLAWALPDARPRPDWLASVVAALAALQVQCPGAADIEFDPPGLASVGPGTPADSSRAQIALHLGPPPAVLEAAAPAAPLRWWLTDRYGRALDAAEPLLEDITAGRGVALALWAPHPRGRSWVCLRQLRVDADPRYARGRRGLARAVARLLWQAGIDLLLDVAPSNHVYPSPRATGLAAERRAPRPQPRQLQLVLGGWRSWLARQRARWFREEWRLGVIDVPPGALASQQTLPATRWLPPCGGLGYWADPAPAAASDSRVMVEYFDERSGIGRIEQLRFSPSQQRVADRQVLPLGGGAHTSFPLVVQLEGRWFGLVETASLRSCVLHEVDAGGRWRPLATPLNDMAAADPALFLWQGRYWLACTDIDRGPMDNLCLFHADRPEGPWLAHANNPVKVDVAGARMAGALFWHHGQLFRPAQNCQGNYGGSVVLQRVLRCSPTEFEEEPVRQLKPDPAGPCPDGMHTVNAWGARTLIDGKRHVFSPGLGLLKLRRRLARRRSA